VAFFIGLFLCPAILINKNAYSGTTKEKEREFGRPQLIVATPNYTSDSVPPRDPLRRDDLSVIGMINTENSSSLVVLVFPRMHRQTHSLSLSLL
jgi:hypothetical protein